MQNMIWKCLRWISAIILLLGIVLFAVLFWLTRPLEKSTLNDNVLSHRFLIAHAGGAIDGLTYTNSKEALTNALDNGFHYIELDLSVTPQGVVCSHDSVKCGEKSLMTLNEAIHIWKERPFKFVVDKISDSQILNQYFETNRAHVYVETFNISEYRQLKHNGYVPMLSVGDGARGLLKYMVTSIYCGKVDWIVTYYQASEYMLRIYKRLGAKVIVYTVNDMSYLKKHIGKDVDMVYTDYLTPSGN